MQTRLIALALLLDSSNRHATLINEKLKRGFSPKKEKAISKDRMVTGLLKLGKLLTKKNADDGKQLASLLYSVALSMDPNNDNLLYENALLERDGYKVKWPEKEAEKMSLDAGQTHRPMVVHSSTTEQHGVHPKAEHLLEKMLGYQSRLARLRKLLQENQRLGQITEHMRDDMKTQADEADKARDGIKSELDALRFDRSAMESLNR